MQARKPRFVVFHDLTHFEHIHFPRLPVAASAEPRSCLISETERGSHVRVAVSNRERTLKAEGCTRRKWAGQGQC